MNLISQILSQSNFDPLNFLGILVTVISSIYIFKNETSISFTKERYEKLIFPLFNLLEPIILDRRVRSVGDPVAIVAGESEKAVDKALKLIDENKNLADGKLIELSYYCSDQPSLENFKDLCSYSSRAYDHACRKLGLKTRSLFYRYKRNQFKNKLGIILFIFSYTLFAFVTMVSAMFVLLFIFIMVAAIYEQSSLTNKTIILCLLIPVLGGIYKYISRNS